MEVSLTWGYPKSPWLSILKWSKSLMTWMSWGSPKKSSKDRHRNGQVITWGHADYGGDSSMVHQQLSNVLQLQVTWRGLTIEDDGSLSKNFSVEYSVCIYTHIL